MRDLVPKHLPTEQAPVELWRRGGDKERGRQGDLAQCAVWFPNIGPRSKLPWGRGAIPDPHPALSLERRGVIADCRSSF